MVTGPSPHCGLQPWWSSLPSSKGARTRSIGTIANPGMDEAITLTPQDLVEFVEQPRQLGAKELMRLAESALLAEGGVVEVVGLDAQARRDVVADEGEPGALLGGEGRPLRDGSGEPCVEAGWSLSGEGFEDGLAARGRSGRARRGRRSGRPASGRCTCCGRGGGEGVPEGVLGPGGVVLAELRLQLLEHGLGEAQAVRAAVEELEGGDLGCDACRCSLGTSMSPLGLSVVCGGGAGVEDAVPGDDVDRLLGGSWTLMSSCAGRGWWRAARRRPP